MTMVQAEAIKKGVSYDFIATKYKDNLLYNTPSIHFCCDKYDETSLKESERKHRSGSKVPKTFEVTGAFQTTAELFSGSTNKVNLQRYICEK